VQKFKVSSRKPCSKATKSVTRHNSSYTIILCAKRRKVS
jgi:hypothetical protein